MNKLLFRSAAVSCFALPLFFSLAACSAAPESLTDENASTVSSVPLKQTGCAARDYDFTPTVLPPGADPSRATSPFHIGNAMLGAEASFMAYFDANYTKDQKLFTAEVKNFQDKASLDYGFRLFRYIDLTSAPRHEPHPGAAAQPAADTQVFFLQDLYRRDVPGATEDVLLIVFRGTETAHIKDLVTDATLAPDEDLSLAAYAKQHGEPGVWVHRGFRDALDSIWQSRILPLVEKYDPGASTAKQKKPVVVAGHSLGGALAHLTALRLASLGFYVSDIYTYGSPRVGTTEFARLYDKAGLGGRTYRVTYGQDVVPSIPCRPVTDLLFNAMNYTHVGQLVHVEPNGSIHIGGAHDDNLCLTTPLDGLLNGNGFSDHMKYAGTKKGESAFQHEFSRTCSSLR